MKLTAGAGATMVAAALLLTGCGSGPKSSASVVNVPYAASLAYIMDQQVGPAYQKASHVTYEGRAGTSLSLVHLIDANSIPADVFLSIGAGPIKDLGRKAPWAIGFASAPLVLAYNPKSPYAAELQAIARGERPFRDLFPILAQPGFKLGRTNPNTDPQGQAFYMMVELAQKLYGLPAGSTRKILGPLDNPREVYSETGILTELQAGNLDATSAFLPEAKEHHLPYIVLPPSLNFADPADAAFYDQASVRITGGQVIRGAPITIDLTVVNGSPAGIRFAHYVLTHPHYWREDGYTVITPLYAGHVASIPNALRNIR
jgi:molybdate/tungstate transport system substrate-binding protein